MGGEFPEDQGYSSPFGGRVAEGLHFAVIEGADGQMESLEENFLFESFESHDWMIGPLWRLMDHLLWKMGVALVMV